MIYLIATADRQFCKIGKAISPTDRLACLQVGSPFELEILATRAEPNAFEQQCHSEFAEDRVRGEWFAMRDNTLRRFLDLEYVEPIAREPRAARQTFEGIDIEEFRDGIPAIQNSITKAKAMVLLAIMDGETPSSLARKAGLHRNALYGCADPGWDPKSSTLEKLWPHLDLQEKA